MLTAALHAIGWAPGPRPGSAMALPGHVDRALPSRARMTQVGA